MPDPRLFWTGKASPVPPLAMRPSRPSHPSTFENATKRNRKIPAAHCKRS